jgi:S1-C subfamily serine protease
MSEDNNNKDKEKGFSFIQEQIVSKKKSKWKRMLFSAIWTIILACIFGFVAAIVFCVTEPSINLFLGKDQDKKTVEFPTTSPADEGGNSSATPDQTDKQNTTETSAEGVGKTGQDDNNSKSGTVVIENTIKADIEDLNNMYAEQRAIANEANKSMVTITSTVNGVDWFENEYEAAKISTGFIVADNQSELLILVNYDKIKDAKNMEVTFYNSFQSKASLQLYDKDLNLAVIAVSLKDVPQDSLTEIKPATLGESYSLIVGSPIIAMGSPNGYGGSLEFGIITSKGSNAYVTDNKVDLFTTDITDNENGSGVILNLHGEVIGIITQDLMDKPYDNVNTAIGISKVKKIIESMVNNKSQVYFGIKGIDMTDKSLLAAKVDNGISVKEVKAESPALKAGIQSGDIILSVNDTPINSMYSFYNIISLYEPKTTIKVTIQRNTQNNSKEMDFKVILGKKK